MLRQTYKILAVAVTVSACGGAAATPVDTHQPTTKELADEFAGTTLADALSRRDHFQPLCEADGYPLPGNINSKESAAAAQRVSEFCADIGKGPAPTPSSSANPTPAPTTTGTTPTPPPPAPDACDKTALNQELSSQSLDSALMDYKKYRCLCDDKGYPLVGNINSKGTTASAFCSAVREKGLP